MKEFHDMIALIVNGCTLVDPEESPPQIYYEWYECIVTRKRNSIWQDTIVKNCGFGNGEWNKNSHLSHLFIKKTSFKKTAAWKQTWKNSNETNYIYFNNQFILGNCSIFNQFDIDSAILPSTCNIKNQSQVGENCCKMQQFAWTILYSQIRKLHSEMPIMSNNFSTSTNWIQ